MSDLISRSAVCDMLHDEMGAWGNCADEIEALLKANDALWQIPAVDAVEVVHGEWVSRLAKHWKGKDECGECGFHERDHRDLSHYNYCPNCGAKMDGERKGDDG